MEIIPIENARVHLTPKPGVDGSDYINGTWVAGKENVIYNKSDLFSFTPLNHSW